MSLFADEFGQVADFGGGQDKCVTVWCSCVERSWVHGRCCWFHRGRRADQGSGLNSCPGSIPWKTELKNMKNWLLGWNGPKSEVERGVNSRSQGCWQGQNCEQTPNEPLMIYCPRPSFVFPEEDFCSLWKAASPVRMRHRTGFALQFVLIEQHVKTMWKLHRAPTGMDSVGVGRRICSRLWSKAGTDVATSWQNEMWGVHEWGNVSSSNILSL